MTNYKPSTRDEWEQRVSDVCDALELGGYVQAFYALSVWDHRSNEQCFCAEGVVCDVFLRSNKDVAEWSHNADKSSLKFVVGGLCRWASSPVQVRDFFTWDGVCVVDVPVSQESSPGLMRANDSAKMTLAAIGAGLRKALLPHG